MIAILRQHSPWNQRRGYDIGKRGEAVTDVEFQLQVWVDNTINVVAEELLGHLSLAVGDGIEEERDWIKGLWDLWREHPSHNRNVGTDFLYCSAENVLCWG